MRFFWTYILAVAVITGFQSSHSSANESVEDLETLVTKLLAKTETPGVAVAIIQDGKTILKAGYGTRKIDEASPVDADTIFQIGSLTKAFTSAAFAQAQDRNEINFDDKVVSVLPDFKLSSERLTHLTSFSDLIAHKSGLKTGGGDLLFMPRTTFSSQELYKATAVIPLFPDLRGRFQYNNIAYGVVAKALETKSGRSWHQIIEKDIFEPIGMINSLSNEAERYAKQNRAYPHARIGPPIKSLGPMQALKENEGIASNIAPAGGIMSSAHDMSKWLIAQLSLGQKTESGRPVWSDDVGWFMWQPQTSIQVARPSGPMAEVRPRFAAYSLGWYVQDFKGYRVVYHAGGTIGFLSLAVMIPELNAGFIVLQNSEEFVLHQTLRYALQDWLISKQLTDWSDELTDQKNGLASYALAQLEERLKKNAHQSREHNLESYIGTYYDAVYKDVLVGVENDLLTIDFPSTMGMKAQLDYHADTTFIARWENPAIEPAFVTFSGHSANRMTNITLSAISPLADFSFDFDSLNLTRQ